MKQLNLLKTLFLLCALLVGSSSAWADDSWSRVTDKKTLLDGGTFIIGYEETANSGIIVPMANIGSATTSAAGFMYSGSTAASGGSGTIDMSSVTTTSKYEVEIGESSEVPGAIYIKIGDNYLGNENTKNNCKLFASQTAKTSFTPTFGSNDNVTLDIEANTLGNKYRYLKYNTGSPRFAVYSTTPDKIVIYKKIEDARTPIATIGDLTPMEIETDAMGSFSVDVTAEDTYSVSYESSDDDILLMIDDMYLAGSSKGNVTVTVTITPDDAVTYKPVSKEFIVQVYDPSEKGTKWNPFTVAEAIAFIDAGVGLSNEYCVIGKIYSVDSYNSTYHSLTYWIADDGMSEEFEVYSGKGIDGADFSSVSDLTQGDIVVVKGLMKLYNGTTYEFDKNNELISRKPAVKYVSDAGYATYVAAYDMEFSEGDAFAVTVDGGVAKLAGVTKVKANTPVLLKGEGYKNVTILAETPAAITTDLKVSNGGDPADAYVLANKTKGVGFYKWNGGSLTSGKVYLYAPGLSAHEYIAFDGEESGDVTGINEIAADKTFNGEFFNLAGLRVAQPTKGLYIVNGKKVIIK